MCLLQPRVSNLDISFPTVARDGYGVYLPKFVILIISYIW